MSNFTRVIKELMVSRDSSLRNHIETTSSSSSSSEEDNNDNNYLTRHRIKDYFEKIVQAYSDAEFKINFRLEKSSFNYLMEFLKPLMVQNDPTHTGGKLAISDNKKVIITIYYLANQDSFRQAANLSHIKSDSPAHAVINEVVELLFIHSPKFIKWPSKEEAIINEQHFFNKVGLKNVLGCIDGCHITTVDIKKDADYINRKGYSSILLQGVVNNKMEFIDVYCGEPGSIHDSRLLRKSGLYKNVQENPSIMYGYFLLGDSAYTCLDWLVPPFKDTGSLTCNQHRFNYIHSSLRSRVENAFGMLKGRFRRLREFQNVNRRFIIKATLSAIVLHNICLAANDEIEVMDENRIHSQRFEAEDFSIERSSRRQQAFQQLFQNSN